MNSIEHPLFKAYLDEACKKISPKESQKIIRLELLDHLEESKNHHEKQGHSAENAVAMALKDMGDARSIGTALQRVRRSWGDGWILAIMTILTVIHMGITNLYQKMEPRFFLFEISWLLSGIAIGMFLFFFDLKKHKSFVTPLLLVAVIALFTYARMTTSTGLIPHLDILLSDHLGFHVNIFDLGLCLLLTASACVFSTIDWERKRAHWLALVLLTAPNFYFLLNYSVPYYLIYSLAFLQMLFAAKPSRSVITVCISSVALMGVLGSAALWFLKDSRSTQILAHFYSMDAAPLLKTLPPPEDSAFNFLVGYFGGYAGGIPLLCLCGVILYRLFKLTPAMKDPLSRLILSGFLTKFFVQYTWVMLVPLGLAPMPREHITLPFIGYPSSQSLCCFSVMGLILGLSRRHHIILSRNLCKHSAVY